MHHQYDDIIGLSHHVSQIHPRMSMHDRAAQFSPFAALRGYESAVQEAGRLTDAKVELGEDEITSLDRKLQWIAEHIDKQPLITVRFFVSDSRKEGGAYEDVSGCVKRIDELARKLIFVDGTQVSIDDILLVDFNG